MSAALAIASINLQDPGAGIDFTQSEEIIDGTITLSGNYGASSTHGDTLNFSGFAQSSLIPNRVEIYESIAAGTAPLGYNYTFSPGTTQANGVLTITGGAASSGQGGTELTNGSAYSSFTPSLNGAVLRFRAWFPRFV